MSNLTVNRSFRIFYSPRLMKISAAPSTMRKLSQLKLGRTIPDLRPE